MSFKTASAILRGRWLIDKDWVQSNLPLVLSAARNEQRLNDDEDRSEDPKPEKIQCRYAAAYSVYPRTDLSQIPQGSIAVVNITGPILKYGEMSSWGSSHFATLVSRLADSPNVAGILLNIDSPGGQADGTSMLADAIIAAKKRKPAYAIIDDGMAASAAMWVASAADQIFVTKRTDMVGSVGVYTTIADWNAYYRDFHKLPVKDIYAPQSTDKNKDYREAIAGNDELVKEDLKVLAQEFIDTIKHNRDGKIKGESWATGKMFYAKDALKIGLIDGIKSLNDVIRQMSQQINNRQKTNNNTMAFNKTIKAARATEFGVDDAGFFLSEEHLNNVESHITAQENEITRLSNEVTAANAAKKKAEDDLAVANATIATLNGGITTLQAKITELEDEGDVTLTSKEEDEAGKAKEAYHLSDKDPFNQLADGLLGKPKAKKEASK